MEGRRDEVGPEWHERRDSTDAVELTPGQYVEARYRRLLLMAEARQWMGERPIVLAPVFATPAFRVGQRELDVDGERLLIYGG